MNLKQLRDLSAYRLGYGSSVLSPAQETKFNTYLNLEHRAIMRKRQCAQFRQSVVPFTCVADNPYAGIPLAVSRVFWIADRDNLTNRLREVALSEIIDWDPSLSSTGQPDTFAILNMNAPVYRHPTGGELWAVSTSASDGATKFVIIEGLIEGGSTRYTTSALNGTTPVVLSEASDYAWTEITKFMLADTDGVAVSATGIVSLNEKPVPGGVELGVITPGRSSAHHVMLQLNATPDAARTYYAYVELGISDMTFDAEEPLFHEDFHEILVEGVVMRELMDRKDDPQYDRAKRRHREIWDDLCLFVARSTDEVRPRGFSRMGAFFPEGT